jgi:rod shape-determining protein MreC
MSRNKLFKKKKAPLEKDLKPPRYSFLFSYNPRLKHSLIFFGTVTLGILTLDLLKVSIWEKAKASLQNEINTFLSPARKILFDQISGLSIKAYGMSKNEKKELLTQFHQLKERHELLKQEVHRLRSLVNYMPTENQVITAKVIGFPTKPFKKAILLDKGKKHGLAKDDAILHGTKIIGRIFQTSDSFSYGILLDDTNSRLPIKIEEVDRKGIAIGLGANRMKVIYLKSVEGISPGAKVISTGKGGIYPPNYNIGIVDKVLEDSVIVNISKERFYLPYVQIQPTNNHLLKIETHDTTSLGSKA